MYGDFFLFKSRGSEGFSFRGFRGIQKNCRITSTEADTISELNPADC